MCIRDSDRPDRDQQPEQVVRALPGARGRQHRRARRRGAGDRRPQWRGQDDPGQPAHRPARAHDRRRAVCWRKHRRRGAGAPRRPRARARLSTDSDLSKPDCGRDHRGGGGVAPAQALAPVRVLHRRPGRRCARARNRADLRPRAAARCRLIHALARRQEAARCRLRLCARPQADPARRAHLRRLHRREASDHAHAHGGGEVGGRQIHHPGRARHGPRRVLCQPGDRAVRRQGAGGSAAGAILCRPHDRRHRGRQTARALMLEIRDLAVDIQGSRVLRGISLAVNAGEIVCLVGRNGAGKTTTFRTIMGFRKPRSGTISFEGRDITRLRPFQIARLGLGFSPEESEVFGELTVAENIAMPTWLPTNWLPTDTGGDQRSAEDRIARAYQIFPKLVRYRDRGGQALSGGERKMVSIARALALGPRLLLLDEPTEGLSPAIVPSIVEGLATIRADGHAIFLAESNIHHVPDFADRLYVIERGEIIFAGKPALAQHDPAVARIISGTVEPGAEAGQPAIEPGRGL